MHGKIITQGMELMTYGMCTVVAFLALLVLVTVVMSALITRHFAETNAAGEPRSIVGADIIPKEQLVALITAGVHQHRRKNP
tara:strand:+ start:196243 stop:196488 length:246 start_codon:yes stop_codon:yes gene_type:complete